MTEALNGDGQGSSNFAPVPVTPSSTPPASAEAERTFRQSEVNDLVGRAKSEAIERYKRESSMASHNYQPPQQQSYVPPAQQPQYMPPQPQAQPPQDDNRVRQLAAEEAQRLRNEWIQESHRNTEEQNAARIASEFFTKVGAGEGGMQTFEKAVSDSGLDLRSIPYHVQLANMVDNTRDVMLELVKNPTKIGAIQNLIDIDLRAGRQPNLAMAEMRKISESIKTNQKASNYQSSQEPLSQMRPSSAGTGNQGPLSVRDYKAKYRV